MTQPGRRRLPVAVAAALVLTVLVELAVRGGSARLPTPRLWSGPEMPIKEQQIGDLAADGGASVVFLGSSTMDAAADPSSYRDLSVSRPLYNASTGAGSMRMIDIWGRLVAERRLKPDVIVLGVVSRELNPNDPEQTRIDADFMRSKAVHRLLGTETPLETLDRRASGISALVRYRSILREPEQVWVSLRGGTFRTGEFGEVVGATGQYQGFLDHHISGSGVTVARLRRTALRDFEIGATQVRTLRQMLRAFRSAGTEVVVVNMPVAAVYVKAHPDGAVGYRRAVDVVRAEAERANARFVDIGPWPDDLMADMGHVNAAGVREFTRTLEPVIADVLAARR